MLYTKCRTLKTACAANKVAVETANQADEHRRPDRVSAARKRAAETADQADEHRKRHRPCFIQLTRIFSHKQSTVLLCTAGTSTVCALLIK